MWQRQKGAGMRKPYASNNDGDDGIEIVSLEDIPNPESEELF